MGDRCWMRVTCRRKDTQLFLDAGMDEVVDDHPKHPDIGTKRLIEAAIGTSDDLVDVEESERNYADTDGLPKDIPYYGVHGEGGSYGAGVFACDGSTFAYAPSGHDRGPIVAYGEDGPDEADVKTAKEYWRVRNRARELLGEPP